MNKYLPLLLVFLLFSVAAFGQKSSKNPNSNGNEEKGRTNLLLPYGNIGINTLSPSERLEVIGNARISDKLFVNLIEVANLSATSLTVSEDLQVGRHVLVSGNIGIGVQIPSERLDINGNLRVSQGIFADAIKTNSFQGVSGTFNQHLNVGELFIVEGNTGLGVSAPVERLEVAGNIKATQNLLAKEVQAESGSFSSSVAIGQGLAVGGNTGLGLQNPSERLEVSGNIKATAKVIAQQLEVEEASFNGNAAIGQNLNVAGTAAFTGGVSMSSLTVAESLQSNSFQTSSANVAGPLAVEGNTSINGNTGIGVANPAERLEVEGNVKVSNTLYAGAIESDGIALENGAIANNLSVGGNALVSGNTGLGVESPSEKLEVAGNIKASGSLQGQNLAVEEGNFSSNVSVGQSLAVAGNADFTGAVAMENLTVSSSLQSNFLAAESGSFTGPFSAGGIVSLDSSLFVSGKIGVGTDKVEGYMLSVGGKIRAADDIRVYPSAEWADYVFEESYALPALQEIAAFIAKHKHLPELPSAAEVKEEGIELGAMDAKLLQKIEEMTLYLLQKEEQIQKLEERLKALEEELKN